MRADSPEGRLRGPRSAFIPAALAALGLIGTAACNQGEPARQEAAAPQADEALVSPEAPAGVALSGAWLSLPAVAGNPGSAYFSIRNSGPEAREIVAAQILGAGRTMLHETTTTNGQARMRHLDKVALPAGSALAFVPGAKHVMAFELDPSLAPGGQTELTLIFANGDKASVPMEIRAPGSAPAHAGAR